MNAGLTAPARRMPTPPADALYPETCTCTPAVRYACGHCYHDQCLDCGFCTIGSCVCHCEYGLGFHPGDSPAEGPMFWIGAHHAKWLSTWGVPMCVSRHTLTGRATLPRAAENWVYDSAAFSELDNHGGWTIGPNAYIRELRQFRDGIGRLVWAGPQDWMCEPDMIAKTGLSVQQHIDRTVGNFVDLMAEDPGVDIIPTVQGWLPADYEACLELYDRRGVRLADYPLVGVGSVCRRKSVKDVEAVLAAVAAAGLRLHGFGLKTQALETCAEYLASADSLAWSRDARWNAPLPQCEGKHKSCSNCVRWAMRWRERVLHVLHAPRQLMLPTTI
ncbi:hypothetical protein OHA02_50220 [Streptomyces phaeochromogenes]|nr:hypothetical protein [Streptomyces phaeochromogenes]